MLACFRQNEKGEKVRYYTHKGYIDQADLELLRKEVASKSKTRFTISAIAALASYHVFNFVPAAQSIVSSKIKHRSAGTLLALGVGAIVYGLQYFVVNSQLVNLSTQILRRNSHPGWYDQSRVVNPDRIFFQLDDAHHNQPTILHSGLSLSNAARLFPDFITGKAPQKPHYPSAHHDEHHH